MKIASVADVKAHFSAYLRASEQGPVVVTRNGKPVAVLVAVSDEEEFERLVLARSPRLQAILAAARQGTTTRPGFSTARSSTLGMSSHSRAPRSRN